jgi:hypothetical protein
LIRSAVLAVALCAAAPAARAQTAVDPPRVEVGVDVERLRVLYHFSNPSSFDTATLVPHFFEQRYAIENLWATADARYTAGIPWRISGGVTVPRDGRADDFDTFFNPGPSIVVSGTTGDARMQAVRLGQFGQIAHAGGARISAGYRLRIDRADFGLGHKTVTRGGALVSAEDVDTRERTTAQLHEFFAARSRRSSTAGASGVTAATTRSISGGLPSASALSSDRGSERVIGDCCLPAGRLSENWSTFDSLDSS